MRKFSSGFSFLMAILLVFSSVYIPSAAAAASEEPLNEKWTKQIDGALAYNPSFAKDGDAIVVTYEIIDGVYNHDFMKISSKNGEIVKEYRDQGEVLQFIGSNGDTYIASLDNKGTLTMYNENLQPLWTKKLNLLTGEHTNVYLEYSSDMIFVANASYNVSTYEWEQNNYYYNLSGQLISNQLLEDENSEDEYLSVWSENSSTVNVQLTDKNWDEIASTSISVQVNEDEYAEGVDKFIYNDRYYVLVGIYNDDYTIEAKHLLLEINMNGDILNTLSLNSGYYTYTSILQDDKLSLAFDKTYYVVDVETLTPKVTPLDGDVSGIITDRNGYNVVETTGNNEKIYIIKEDGSLSNPYQLPNSEYGYSIFGLGEYTAFAPLHSDGKTFIYSSATQNLVQTLDSINNLAYDSNNKTVLTGRSIGDVYEDNKNSILTFYNVGKKASEPKKGFEKNKEWTITFSQDVDAATVDSESVYVLDAKGNKVDGITYSVEGKKVIARAPSQGYTSGGNYTLYVTPKVKSSGEESKALKEQVTKQFDIQ